MEESLVPGTDMRYISPVKESSPNMTPSPARYIPAAVFLLALAVRMAYLFETGSHPLAAIPQKGMDQHRYWSVSGEILSGDILCESEAITPPLYHYCLAAARALPGSGTFVPFAVQSVFGALACVLIYLLARQLFDETAGLAAGALSALFGPFIFYDSALLRASPAVFLTALLCFTAFHAGRRHSLQLWALAGFVMAGCVFMQENLLAYLPFMLYYAIYTGRQGRHGSRTWLFAAVFLLATAAAAFPFAIRNTLLERPALRLSGSGPIAIIYGNSIDSAPYGEVIPASFQDTMRISGGSTAKVIKHLALDAIRHPGAWLKNEALKFAAYWNAYEVPCNLNYHLFTRFSKVLAFDPVTFGIISPLGIAGMILLFRKRRSAAILYMMTAACVMSVVPFYVISRLRLPLGVPLIIFSSFTLGELVEHYRSRSIGRFLSLFVFVALLFMFTENREPRPVRPNDYFNLGNALRGAGSNTEAIGAYRKALELDHTYSSAHLNLGNIHMENKNYQLALEYYISALQKAENEASVRLNISAALLALGREDEAAREWERILVLDPGNTSALGNLKSYRNKEHPAP